MTSNTQGDTPTDNSGKIACKKCGREDVPNWNGKGSCISCARDEVLGTPNTPIEDELEHHLYWVVKAAKSHYSGQPPVLSPGDVKMAESLPGLVSKAVAEAQSRHITDLARAVGILQGLGHPDVLLERHYNEAVARLTTPTKGKKKDDEY